MDVDIVYPKINVFDLRQFFDWHDSEDSALYFDAVYVTTSQEDHAWLLDWLMNQYPHVWRAWYTMYLSEDA
jgi:hypothetical protein